MKYIFQCGKCNASFVVEKEERETWRCPMCEYREKQEIEERLRLLKQQKAREDFERCKKIISEARKELDKDTTLDELMKQLSMMDDEFIEDASNCEMMRMFRELMIKHVKYMKAMSNET